MYSPRSQLLALALLLVSALAALILAAVAVLGMQLTPHVAVLALGLSAVLIGGAVFLHSQLREARWDAGLRLR